MLRPAVVSMVLAIVVALVACGRLDESPAVGQRVVVGNEGWDAHACGTPLPRVFEIGEGRFPDRYVWCPRSGKVWLGPATVAEPVDEVLGRVAYGFHYQVWVLLMIALLGLILPWWLPRLADPFGLAAVRANLDATRAVHTGGDPRTLAPLCCPTCARPAPLVDADAVPCAGCKTSIPIPPDYRALGGLRAQASRDHAAAVKLWRAYEVVVRVATSPITIAVAIALVTIEIASAAYGLVNGMLHRDYRLFVPAMLLACIAVVRQLWRLRPGKRVEVRPELVLPADRTGDTGACATCGAPLAMPPPGFFLVPCLYCGTEHLLGSRVSRGRAVSSARARVAAGSLFDATLAMHRALTGVARTVWGLAWGMIGVTALIAMLAARC